MTKSGLDQLRAGDLVKIIGELWWYSTNDWDGVKERLLLFLECFDNNTIPPIKADAVGAYIVGNQTNFNCVFMRGSDKLILYLHPSQIEFVK